MTSVRDAPVRYVSAGEVNVAYQVFGDLVLGSDIRLEPRGPHELKGISGPVELFALRPV